jgi:hypothetical protein
MRESREAVHSHRSSASFAATPHYFELRPGGFSDGFSSFQTGRGAFSFPTLKEVFP